MSEGSIKTSKSLGRYRLVAEIATGGMADIFLALHSGLGGFEKLVVIKRVLPNLAKEPEFIQMILDEARIAALLNHPNVIQVFDVGREEGEYYIAMEYLAGETVAKLLQTCRRKEATLPPEFAASIIMQAAEGLHHAHTLVSNDGKPLNLVHRDVSPQNIFVLYDGGVKVMDFGIAKAALSQAKTRTGHLKGKVAYMSPEQVLGQPLDARSDVFALGIMLWECLTIRKLFKGNSDYTLMQSIVQEEAPSPLDFNRKIPKQLADIVRRALERDRDKRYQTAAALRADLAAYLRICKKPADTMAIRRWMQDTFAGRIKQKRDTIEHAQHAEVTIDQELFGATEVSDTETSALKSDVETMVVDTGDRTRPRPRRRWPLALAGLGLGAAGLAAALLFIRGAPSEPADPLHPADAGGDVIEVVAPPAAVDASTAVATRDAGAGALDPIARDLDAATASTDRRRRPSRRGKGTLDVACLPWCEIWIDGRPTGKSSPLQGFPLPTGRHTVEAKHPPSGASKVQKVTIKRDKRSQVRFRLP